MNKQELIERIKKAKSFKLDESIINGPVIDFVELNTVIKLVNQTNDTQKVKIPRFLANWIESYKHARLSLSYAMSNISPEIRQWMDGDCVTKAEIFARAWLDGYEIEKPKYVVTDGNHLYFKKYQEDVEIVILADEQPGTMAYVNKFDTKEEAQEVADILGWKVEELRNES